MVHRRIQKKNRKKLKPVDPFNKKRHAIKAAQLVGKNNAPKRDDIDDQQMPRGLVEIQASQKRAAEREAAPKQPKVTKDKNRVYAEAKKMGVERRKYESEKAFFYRVLNAGHAAVQAEIMKTKMGAGEARTDKELAEDYKEMAEKEEQKKQQEKNRIDNERAERFGVTRKQLAERDEERKRAKAEAKAAEKGIELPAKKKKEEEVQKKPPTKKELKKQREKAEKLKERDAVRKEALLDAKEVIGFGERYDAPPEFSAEARKKLSARMSYAGGKRLLLHEILEKQSVKAEEVEFADSDDEEEGEGGEKRKKVFRKDDKEKKTKLQELERQRVIDAYRGVKRQKREANAARALAEKLAEERAVLSATKIPSVPIWEHDDY